MALAFCYDEHVKERIAAVRKHAEENPILQPDIQDPRIFELHTDEEVAKHLVRIEFGWLFSLTIEYQKLGNLPLYVRHLSVRNVINKKLPISAFVNMVLEDFGFAYHMEDLLLQRTEVTGHIIEPFYRTDDDKFFQHVFSKSKPVYK